MGVKYGSAESIELAGKIMERITCAAYRASIELAQEKGAFEMLDKAKYCAGKFIQSLPQDIRDGIMKYGIRNSHLTSIAPTGTISLLAGNVSSGRFTGSYDAADAVVVYVEKTEAEGEVLLYFLNGETKTYIVMDDSSTGCKLTTTASEASVFEWNATYNTYEVAADDNARAFGFDPSKDFTTFSAYAISNGTKYNWGQFTAVA